MKNKLCCFICVILAGCSGARLVSHHKKNPVTDTKTLLSFQNKITPAFLHSRLAVISDDSMQGRETAMPGQKKAAAYLASQYKKMGLKPMGDHGSYFQSFSLKAKRPDSLVFETFKKNENGSIQMTAKSVSSRHSSAQFIRRFGGDDTLNGDIIFAGFGFQNEALHINPLQGVDVRDKWVMVFSGDLPQVVNGDTLYTDPRQFNRSRLQQMMQKGAAGMVVIPNIDGQTFEKEAIINRQHYGKPTQMRLAYRAPQTNRAGFSYDFISPSFAANLLDVKEGVSGLSAKKDQLMRHLKTFKAQDTGYKLKQTSYTTDENLKTENVVAMAEGADPALKNQIVVLSAHYDHLGIGQADSTGDTIYNGADDDGSGTVGLLNMAQVLADAQKKGVRPRRSILFLHFTGEEKGLLGSRYYSDHPVVPIKQTIADLNTDMIGRIDPKHQQMGQRDYTYVIGSDLISSDLDSLLKAANSRAGSVVLSKRYNDLNDPNQFYRRSDHWNFGRLGVPFVFFFTGVHKDYHRPSDEIDKIMFNKMAKIVRTIYATTILTANTDTPPKVDNQAFINATQDDER